MKPPMTVTFLVEECRSAWKIHFLPLPAFKVISPRSQQMVHILPDNFLGPYKHKKKLWGLFVFLFLIYLILKIGFTLLQTRFVHVVSHKQLSRSVPAHIAPPPHCLWNHPQLNSARSYLATSLLMDVRLFLFQCYKCCYNEYLILVLWCFYSHERDSQKRDLWITGCLYFKF